MTATKSERERGWQVFACPKHGELVCTVRHAIVVCSCGRKAKPDGPRARHSDGDWRIETV